MIELRVLGGLQLRDAADGREILSVLARTKPPGVLVYLALAPANVAHGRDELLELFWPDSSTEKARNSLNQALHILRRGLGPGVIGTTEGGEPSLEAGSVWCDVAAFDDASAAGHEREALELYGGHLWGGSDFSDCPAFERWLDGQRQRLRLQAVVAAVTLAQELERDGSVVDAAQWLRRARDWAPYDDAVMRPLLNLLHRQGERAAAVREYDAYEKRLAEVGLTPSTQMAELIEEIPSSRAGTTPAVLPAPRREGAGRAGVTTQPRASWRARGRAAAAIVVLGAISVIGASVVSNGRGDAAALDPTRVLVDIFRNETGDPSLDRLGRIATDRVTAGLTSTSFIDVVSLGTQLLSLEAVVADTDSTEPSGRLQALARANGTGTAVSGSYYLQGDSVLFLAHVTNASTGRELAALEPVVGAIDAPVSAIEQLRDRVMTTLATLTDPRLAEWMQYASQPPTFEAYREFVDGIELHMRQKPSEALPRFLAAAALDSDFTMASLWAVNEAEKLRRWALIDSISQTLHRRRDRMAPLDRLLWDHTLGYQRNDFQTSLQAMRRFVEIAPGSEFLHEAGNAARMADPREGIELATRADLETGWMRGWGSYWVVLLWSHHRLGDYERELEIARQGRRQFPNSFAYRAHEVDALAAMGRIDVVNARIDEALEVGTPRDVNGIISRAARELLKHGYRAAGMQMLQRHIEWWESRPPEEIQGRNGGHAFFVSLMLVGRLDEARKVIEGIEGLAELIKLGDLAELAAREGRPEEVLRISRRADSIPRPPGQGPVPNVMHRAHIAVSLGDWERAITLLRELAASPGEARRLHALHQFEPLWGYPPFEELLRRNPGG